jgi:hypothetical protein
MSEFKHHDELAKDNPGGLDTLETPHNFSSNPGFMSTMGMLGASSPAGGGVIRPTSARGSLPRPVGNPARPVNTAPISRPVASPASPVTGFNARS